MKKIIYIALLLVASSAIYAQQMKFDIHGFVSQGYIYSEDNEFIENSSNGSADFNEFGINFNSKVSDNTQVGLQLLSRDFGSFGNNKIDVDWAYGSYRFADEFSVKAGLLRIPYGLYNEIRDIDLLRNTLTLPQSVYREDLRDVFSKMPAIGVSGFVNMMEQQLGSVKYDVAFGQLFLDEDGYIDREIASLVGPEFVFKEYDKSYRFSSHLEWQLPVEGLSVLGSFAKANFKPNFMLVEGTNAMFKSQATAGIYNGTKAYLLSQGMSEVDADKKAIELTNETMSGISHINLDETVVVMDVNSMFINAAVKYEHELFSFEGEVTTGTIEVRYETPDDFTFVNSYFANKGLSDIKLGDVPAGYKEKFLGYYANLAYNVTDWATLGTYYSEYYPDLDKKDDGLCKYWSKTISAYSKFMIGYNWTIKAELQKINGTAQVAYGTPNNLIENWMMGAVKFTYNF